MMHFLKRTMAFVLTFVICAETLLGGGVASAVALSPDNEGLSQQTEQLLTEDNAASAVNVDAGTNSANSTQAVSVIAASGSVQSVSAAGAIGDQSAPVVTAVDGASASSNVNASSTLDATIDVFWASVDDEGDDVFDADDNRVWTQDPSQYKSNAAATKVRVLRNGANAAELEITGEVDAAAHEAVIGGDAFAWQEVAPWRVLVSGLPEYNANGIKYNYLFLEEPASGFASQGVERSVDAENGNLYTRFCNARANAGEGTVVPVSVRWVDGGDAASRVPVQVGLYANRTIGIGGQIAYDKDNYISSENLSEDNFWYNEMNVPVGGLDVANDFYIAELSTFFDGGEAQGCYKVVSRDEAARNFENPEYTGLLRNWSESDSSLRMLSADPNQGFAYRVTYGSNSVLGSHEVVNRRIGFTEVAISRTWLDEGVDETARPKSTFTLASSGSGIEFVYNAGGVISARVSEKDYALYKKDTSGSLTPLTLSNKSSDVTVSAECDSLTISSDAFGDSLTYVIANLPEYDAQGSPVNWTVEQNWAGEHGDYQISGGDAEQTRVSSWHQEDQLTFSFVNKREGVKSVTFHAKWFDHYVKDELNQRPDVNLKLYRLVNKYGADGNVVSASSLEAVPADEYDARGVWSASDPADCAANDSSGEFTQYITLADLPKYDAQGRAYIYYACVDLDEAQGGQGTLSYYYDGNISQDNYTKDPGSWNSANAEIARSASEAKVSESAMAYREDSTFNYRVCGEATLSGKLYWVDKNNAFDTRPTSVSLKMVRAHQDGSPDGALVGGETNLQTTDSSAPNYLAWTVQSPDSNDVWTYKIYNLEKWDSEGRPWVYTVSENSVDSQYEIKPGTDNGGFRSSIESEFPDITNVLKDLATLAKTDISGNVSWNDYGSGLAGSLDPATCGIKLKLFRSVAGGSEELVVDGSAGALPDSVLSWNKNSDGTWTYSFKNLPEYDQNACEYTYRVKEAGSDIPGWHFAGYSENGAITYAASHVVFGVDSGSDSSADLAKLNGATFELFSGTNKIAIWSLSEDGTAAAFVADGFGVVGVGESTGWIVGLPAGEYMVHEAVAPKGYRAVDDFKIAIDTEGIVTLLGDYDYVRLGENDFAFILENEKDSVDNPVEPGGSGDSGNSGTSDGSVDDSGKSGVLAVDKSDKLTNSKSSFSVKAVTPETGDCVPVLYIALLPFLLLLTFISARVFLLLKPKK